ncbi:type II toxin-antitoxin system RelE/ParE family toxin [Candidatus Saccharibacteria bacterium]|nr:type II toxin-antitoxin system RelE/ParE family toxin [Candidatus Saccharibacteria bacterium]
MIKLNIIFAKSVRDDIKKLDRQVAARICKKLAELASSGQPPGSAVRLAKPADAQYRWRMGHYRVLFDFDSESNTATILKIQHRRQIYRR